MREALIRRITFGYLTHTISVQLKGIAKIITIHSGPTSAGAHGLGERNAHDAIESLWHTTYILTWQEYECHKPTASIHCMWQSSDSILFIPTKSRLNLHRWIGWKSGINYTHHFSPSLIGIIQQNPIFCCEARVVWRLIKGYFKCTLLYLCRFIPMCQLNTVIESQFRQHGGQSWIEQHNFDLSISRSYFVPCQITDACWTRLWRISENAQNWITLLLFPRCIQENDN